MHGTPFFCLPNMTHFDHARSINIRAVLSRGGKALDLTEDHKPNAPREMERIYRCGVVHE